MSSIFYRSIHFTHALKLGGNDNAFYQIHDPKSSTSYVKQIERVGNEIVITGWKGETVDATSFQLVWAHKVTERDLKEIAKWGHVLTDFERDQKKAASIAAAAAANAETKPAA